MLRDEVRCPWCTTWTPAGGHCRKCGCKLVPAEHFGAARMLVHKGVDQLSLADRVAALEPGMRDTLSAQFAAQLAVVAARSDELRYCERFLFGRGHAARLEDWMIPTLPVSPARLEELRKGVNGPFVAGEDRLAEILEAHPRYSPTRELAAIALLRRGQLPRDAIHDVDRGLDSEDTAFDALVALACWRARPLVDFRRYAVDSLRKVATDALASDALAPWAAVVLSRWSSRDPKPEWVERLRQGLSSSDPELRFECALALGDGRELELALGSGDADKASLARRVLARNGHAAVLRVLAEGSDDARREVVNSLRHPIDARTAAALVEALPRVAQRERDSIVSLIRGLSFGQHEEATRAEWISWARAGAPGLTAAQAFELLEWAGGRGRDGGWNPTPGEAADAFVQVAAAAFRAAEREEQARRVRDGSFAWLLALAGAGQLPLFVEVATDPELGEPFFEQLFYAQSVSQYDKPDPRVADVLFAIWDAAGEAKASLVAPLEKVTGSNRGVSGRDFLLERIWRRAKGDPDERRLLVAAFRPWQDELIALYDADPEQSRDPVDRFRYWADAAPDALWPLMNETWSRVPPERTLALVEAAFSAAEAIVDRKPRSAVAAVSRAAAALVNAYRDNPAPGMDAWIETLAARFSTFEPRFRSAQPESDSESGAENLLDDVHTELRLAAEARERREEDARREREREQRRLQQEARQREAEAQQREMERQLQAQAEPRAKAQREAAAQAEAMAAQVAAAVARAVPPKSDGPLQPRIPAEPIDSEPLLAGTPLPTLVDYVRFMKQMSGGADVMQLFAANGLSVQTWPVVVSGWSAILGARTDVGMRFGALMAAPWG
ncbi:MAG TPA: hypothetical protein VK447_14165 [Myxococcaceae bacterium]|nr:hypothetical protein [Myxococcaceae bacterium]